MQRYPLWKGVLVAAVTVAAILIALPNLYGESPALQLSRRDRANFTPESVTEISGALHGARISSEEVYVDDDAVVDTNLIDRSTEGSSRPL